SVMSGPFFFFSAREKKRNEKKTGDKMMSARTPAAAAAPPRQDLRRRAGQDRLLPSITCSRTPVAVAYSAASRANRPPPAGITAGAPAAGAFSVAFTSIDSILETLTTSTSRARAQA